MARPLRIEFAGALYHITARGNSRESFYRYYCKHHWLFHAYCLMSNHYHLLIETQIASLSKGIKLLNGGYT